MSKKFLILLTLAFAAHGQMQEKIAIIQTLDNHDLLERYAMNQAA